MTYGKKLKRGRIIKSSQKRNKPKISEANKLIFCFTYGVLLLVTLAVVLYLIAHPREPAFTGSAYQVAIPQETFSKASFSYIAPKAEREPCCQQEYPYIIPLKLTDGVYASDDPADPAWVEFSDKNVNPYFFSVNGYLRTARPNMAKLLGEMRAGTHRADYKWSNLEKTKGVYDWSYLDARTQQAAQYGIKPYFLIMGTPAWTQQAPDPAKPPDNPQDYADFIVAFAKHIDATFPDDTSKVIEVWNEINEKFWAGTEKQYLQMLEATYKAVKAVDPSWRIMAETFSGMQIPEFDYMYSFKDENGESILKKYSDLIAIHPYGKIYGPDEPMDPTIGWSNFALLADNTQRIRNNKVPDSPWGWCCFAFTDEDDPSPNILRNWRQVMIKNGDGDKKVWLTEIGWHRNMFDGSDSKWPYPPDDKRIAELITRLFEKSSEYDFVESVTIYDLWADNTANLIRPYNNAYNYTKSNAYYAFQNLATTDGIVIDLSKSPTNVYPAPQFNIKSVKVSSLNYAQNGQNINRIEKISVSISKDNINYTNIGQITNNGPKTGKVELKLDNINQLARWIKLEITQETGTTSYLIDEVDVLIPSSDTISDTIPPTRSSGQPSGTLAAGTASTSISFSTDENANCSYSTTAGTDYGSMNAFTATEGTSHSTAVSGLSDGNSYTYYVKCSDAAGNKNIDDYSISFSIGSITQPPASGGGGSSGGGGGGGGSGGGGGLGGGGFAGTKESFFWSSMQQGTTTETLTKESIAIKQTSITLKNKANNISLTIEKLASKPSAIPETNRKTYQYLQITKNNLQDSDVLNVNIKFKVEKSWLLSTGIDENGIAMLRLTDKWDELTTRKLSSDSAYAYYEAESPGLSYFAITENVALPPVAQPVIETTSPQIQTPPIEPAAQAPETEKPTAIPKKKFNWLMLTFIASIVFLAGIGAFIYGKQKNYKKIEPESYVQDALKRGYSEEQIRNTLENAGWPEEEIEKALRELKE